MDFFLKLTNRNKLIFSFLTIVVVSFFIQTMMALLVAFLLMGIVVFIYFRSPIPSLAVILAAGSDIICTVAIFNLTGEKLSKFKNINWIISPAEKIPLSDNLFDFYTISFGLRNTANIDKALSEAYRVLKPGGRFLCLEFSKIQNTNLETLYKNYSKLIPSIGKFVVGEKQPYEYLIKSIEDFLNQEELIDAMVKNNFKKCTYRNLSGGIVSIHSGWKF